ncbi:hypothetical protein [Peptacetobacter sp.]|uniref:hypothetical protein n=1 Tax=Peptacetobacter sp. TaxID=2991975 RepID=UPI003AB5F23C
MAKIKLMEGGFTLLPEGVTTFKIVSVEYKEDFGKMKIELQTKGGQKHYENFSLLTKAGEINEGALKAFSYFAKTALNNYSLDEIDEQDLVGCYITAEVTHEEFESNKEPGKMLKSVRLKDYAVAVGFGSSNTTDNEPLEDDDLDDLDDFLND